jgi:hypothetical protein
MDAAATLLTGAGPADRRSSTFGARMTVAFVMNRYGEHGGIDQRGIDVVIAANDSLT